MALGLPIVSRIWLNQTMKLPVEKVTMHMDSQTFASLQKWVETQSQNAGEFDILVGEAELVMFDTELMEEVTAWLDCLQPFSIQQQRQGSLN